jgi:TP901 family phage tail tape measure protein
MADVGEIRGRLTLSLTDWNKSQAKAKSDMQGLGKSAQQTAKDFNTISRASMAVGGAIALSLGASVKTAATFQASLSKLSAISGATESEMETLETRIRDLAKTSVYSAGQTADAARFMAMAGMDVSQIYEGLPAVLNLAASSAMDLGQASDIATNILSGFGLQAKDLTRVVDVMAKTATSSNTNVQEMGEGMKYIAPVAKSLGMSVEETSAAIGILANNGLKGSVGANALRAGFLSLVNPTGQTEEAIEALNLQFKDQQGELKSLPDIIEEVREKTEGMTETQKAATLSQLVGVEASSAFLALVSEGPEKLRNYTKELEDSAGSAEKMAATMNDNLLGAFKEFQSAMEELGITVGNSFLPMFTEIVKEGTEVVRAITEIDGATIKAGAGFALTASGIALAISAIGKLSFAIRGLMVSLGPAGWLTLALSTIGGLLVGAKVHTDALNDAQVERLSTLQKEHETLETSIADYEALNEKMKLSSDEFARFLDISTLMSQTDNQETLKALADEQDRLREKSGLSADEFDRLVGLNKDLTESVPNATSKITDQGNAILETTDSLKKYNEEQLATLQQELELERLRTESDYNEKLSEQERVQRRINDLNSEKNEMLKELQSLKDTEKQKELELKDMQENKNLYSQQEIDLQETSLKQAQDDVDLMDKRIAKHVEKLLEEQKSLETLNKEIKGMETVRNQLVEIAAKQADLNAEKGKELETVDKTLSKLYKEREQLEDITSANERNTDEYKSAKKALDEKISKLEDVRGYISGILGIAENLNSKLAQDITKRVFINEVGPRNYSQARRAAEGVGAKYHTGGIVGRGQMPKLHTGGLASQFAQAPLHNEIDVRLLRDEMVLTSAQQANLMRMIDAGSTGGQSNDSGLNDILGAVERLAGKPVNISLVADGKTLADVTYKHTKDRLSRDTDSSSRNVGQRRPR